MNQDLMLRLFRSIDGDKDDDVVKVASLIIEDEIKKGHTALAAKLKSILDRNVATTQSFRGELRKILPNGISIPKDKRNNFPLAISIDREELRHEMVLPIDTEEKLRRIEKEFAAKERLASHGLKYRQKILIYGEPGCGKSMSAERIAWNLGLPFLKVRFDVIISSFLGETASNLSKLFDGIQDYPCVLLFDEFDIIGKTRTNLQDVGEMHRIVNILLTLLEEYNSKGILIATTNIENALDQALFRRFDDIIEMPKPSKEEVLRLIKQTLSSIDTSKDIDWDILVDKMLGFNAALVVKIANDAAKIAVIGNDRILRQYHLEKSLSENNLYKK
ncbi:MULTISPECIES: AAA family ATPase [Flavobacterium]|uniref:ATP-binding protein n=1 Tax=Flavobacterium microcysteis TaxID=2596891 RepID=A0A501Q0K1_9FLAO|nr:ATP-binding protein [Flavobacterium microcysteis]TPD65737.1 ATP-binding protein [Flavobacterium microcysteis]